MDASTLRRLWDRTLLRRWSTASTFGWSKASFALEGGLRRLCVPKPDSTAISASEECDWLNQLLGPFDATLLDECARRDVKGLYEKAFSGEIATFTGVNDPYEEPANPELRIDTEEHVPEESAQIVLAKLAELGLVADEIAV